MHKDRNMNAQMTFCHIHKAMHMHGAAFLNLSHHGTGRIISTPTVSHERMAYLYLCLLQPFMRPINETNCKEEKQRLVPH